MSDRFTGIGWEARRELAVLFETLDQHGAKFLFAARSDPQIPRNDPVVVQGWAMGQFPIMLSIRGNSGQWTAYFPVSLASEDLDLKRLKQYLETIQERLDKAKKEALSAK